MMNLMHFANTIDRAVYLRGYDYYENDAIASLRETTPNTYHAEVKGTETYSVAVSLDEQLNIVKTSCDCPYDWGDTCKHQVAVFLAIRDIKNGTSKKARETDPFFSTDTDADLTSLLQLAKKDDLVRFLLDIAAVNEEIRQSLLLRFMEPDDEDELRQATSMIRASIRAHADRHGFVDYRGTHGAVQGAERVMDKVEEVLAHGRTVHAVNLILCVVGEMVDLLQASDDSGGTIGGVVERSLGTLKRILEQADLHPDESGILFETLRQESLHSRYDGWTEWRLDYLAACSLIADSQELYDRWDKLIVQISETESASSQSSRYFLDKLHEIRYTAILRQYGEANAQSFIEQNLTVPYFREIRIQRAIQVKDLERVVSLAADGEACDATKPGLVRKWKTHRYEACQQLGWTDSVRDLAMEFILDGSFDHYLSLKRMYEASVWSVMYPQILIFLEQEKSQHASVYTRILVEEGEKAKLFETIRHTPASIEYYDKFLLPEFKDEVFALYVRHIEKTARRANTRSGYQGVCNILRNLMRAGGTQQALAIKQDLLEQYNRRPAFKDELMRV